MKEGKMEYNVFGCAKLLTAIFSKDYTSFSRAAIRGDILEILRNGIKKEEEERLEKIDTTFLPKSTKFIVEAIGKEGTLKLINGCKRTHLYIPKEEMTDDHFIVNTIGRESALKLQRVFGGEIIKLARCKYFYKEKRNEEIRKKLIAIKDEGVIAEEYNISLSQIRRIFYPRLAEKNRQLQRERRRKKANEPNSLVNSFVRMLGVNSNISIHAIGGAMGPSEGGRERVG